MDSRPGDMSTTATLLTYLPEEIQLEIFHHANLSTLGRMQQTCQYYNRLLLDDKFWDHKQTQEFTSSPFIRENKVQYRAELLFQRMLLQKDADKKQLSALKLRNFLSYQSGSWTHYYHGASLFKGLGTKVNRDQGFQTLMKALDANDYRAAMSIGRILVDANIQAIEQFDILIAKLDSRQKALLMDLVHRAHENKILSATKLLARLHAYGICTPANFYLAEKYLLSVSTHSANEINALGRLKFNALPRDIDFEQKIQQVVDYLSSLTGRLPETALQNVINYWSAYLAITRGDDDAAIRLLENAADVISANRFLGYLLANRNLPELGVMRLIGIADTEENISGDLFDLQMQFSTIGDTVRRTRDLTHCSMITLAKKVSEFYRLNTEITMLAVDPYIIWWLQLAAQAGCVESLDALLSINAKHHPFVCYALAIINKFGILHSESINPDHDKAEYYFNLARGIDLKEYLRTGQDHDFINQETLALLESKMHSSPMPGR